MKKILFCCIALLSSSLIPSCSKDYSTYTVACVGDSITYGYDPVKGGQMEEPYPLLLEKEMGFKAVYNYGIGGCYMSDCVDSWCPMVNRIKNIDPNCNVVIVWGTGNDLRNVNYELGYDGDTKTSTYYGALNNICSFLNTNFKNAFKMFITSLPFKLYDTIYYLNSLKKAINTTCNKFNIPVLDFTKDSGFEEEIESGKNDGVHPTQEFVRNTIVPKISSFIRTHMR